MQIVKSSERFVGADARRHRWVAAAAMVLASVFSVLPAQAQPLLRIGAGAATTVRGTSVDGGPAFPASALELLGFTLTHGKGSTTAVLAGDTIRFWETSPFFRHGRQLQHLAHPVVAADGGIHLPEQLFIQWLPAAFPARFQYRNGVLARRDDAVTATSASARPRAPEQASPASQPRPVPSSARMVFIDPGHGGVDPGRIGPNGLREKDVVLRISRRVSELLVSRGYEVHMTRTTDTLIALADRAAIANRLRQDRPGALFLSIHANAATSSAARGFETFFLSEARTADERRVAEMENEAVQYEEATAAAAGNGLDQVLAGLRSDFLMRASHDLAAAMQERLALFHPGPNRGVKRAGFLVLVGAVMPAVLIETAFISNRQEAAMLADETFQQDVAKAVADGVDEFFRRNEHLWTQQP